MQEAWIALILACVFLGVSLANLLFPVKEWLHHWFPGLWPPSNQNDVQNPVNLELGGVMVGDSTAVTLASLNQRVTHLKVLAGLVNRVQTVNPPVPSTSDGSRDVQRRD